ncbi:MAG: hypothetical protein M3X11_05090, partial [Acidobacteriota bacterium]|nr:hypothetical protein [Acidobacteriota bacterium]
MKTSTTFFGKALKCIGLTISLAALFSASAAVDHAGHSVPATKPAAAFCSCCPDAGTWSNALQKVQDFEFEIFDRLQFDNAAHLYLTVASPDDTVGIEFPAGD